MVSLSKNKIENASESSLKKLSLIDIMEKYHKDIQEVFTILNETILTQERTIRSMKRSIDEQNKKINKLTQTITSLETKVHQQNERDVNKAIRQYSMKKNPRPPINFIATKTPLSEILG